MYLTIQYALSQQAHRGVTMLPKDLYGKYEKGPAALMIHLHGSSWHGNDAGFVFWLDTHWKGLVLIGCCIVLSGLAWSWYRQGYGHMWGTIRGVLMPGIGSSKAYVASSEPEAKYQKRTRVFV